VGVWSSLVSEFAEDLSRIAEDVGGCGVLFSKVAEEMCAEHFT
jgi:hypothetical protein